MPNSQQKNGSSHQLPPSVSKIDWFEAAEGTQKEAGPTPKKEEPTPKKEEPAAQPKKKASSGQQTSTSGEPKKSSGKKSQTKRTKNASSASSGSSSKKGKTEQVDLELPRSTRPAHRVIPYILFGLAAFVAICLILNLICNVGNKCQSNPSSHWMGPVGYYICYGLFGTFGPAVFCLPLIILNLAFFWKAYIDNKLVIEKTLASVAVLVFLSTFIHTVCLAALRVEYQEIPAFTTQELLNHGAKMTGGGVVGGQIGYFLVRHMNLFGGITVSVFLTVLSVFFFLGMTPQHLLEHIRTNKNLKKAARMPVDVAEEEEIREEMQRKHRRASGGNAGSPEDSGDRPKPPEGAVQVVSPVRSHERRSSDGLAPMPMPVLDATDETSDDSQLFVPTDMRSDDDVPAVPAEAEGKHSKRRKSKKQEAAGRSEEAPSVSGSADEEPAPATKSGDSPSVIPLPEASGQASSAELSAEKGSPMETDGASVSPSAAPKTASEPLPKAASPIRRTASSDDIASMDAVFPRSGAEVKTLKKVQRGDRKFELESIFSGSDEGVGHGVRKHAPVPPEVPMPNGSAPHSPLSTIPVEGGSADTPVHTASTARGRRPSAPNQRQTVPGQHPMAHGPAASAGTPLRNAPAGTAGRPQTVPGGRTAVRSAVPSPASKPAAPGSRPSATTVRPASAPAGMNHPAKGMQKPIFRAADRPSEEVQYGLTDEEFEKREAAGNAMDAAIAAKKKATAKAGETPAGVQAKKPTAAQASASGPAAKVSSPKSQAPVHPEDNKPYTFPPISYLHPGEPMTDENQAEIQANMEKLSTTLNDFNIRVDEITYSCGPTVTRYEIFPSAGVRVRSIMNLSDDIALTFALQGVRMEAISGKSAIGVEVPNPTRNTVFLRDLIESKSFTESSSKLTAGLGVDVTGRPLLFNIAKMPHLLVAGATGMGKSVCINCIIMSILFKARPDEVKLILIDPKKVEFGPYKGIPHLMAPIITTPKDAAGALQAAVNEMEDRFAKIQDVGVHDIDGYNKAAAKDPDLPTMPKIVIIIDELADLMMTARDEVEQSICRLAQKARAAGMYLIAGTQRPSVDVVTGLIKSNIPSRIACTVSSQVDSRTILDVAGAEKLLGRGDMLFAPVGSMKPTRVQGAFVSDEEVEKICEFIKATNGTARYNENFTGKMKEYSAQCGKKERDEEPSSSGGPGERDVKFIQALKVGIEENKISTSLLQRKLGIGYGRSAKIIDSLEAEGFVGPQEGNKPRAILITAEEFIDLFMTEDGGGQEGASKESDGE